MAIRRHRELNDDMPYFGDFCHRLNSQAQCLLAESSCVWSGDANDSRQQVCRRKTPREIATDLGGVHSEKPPVGGDSSNCIMLHKTHPDLGYVCYGDNIDYILDERERYRKRSYDRDYQRYHLGPDFETSNTLSVRMEELKMHIPHLSAYTTASLVRCIKDKYKEEGIPLNPDPKGYHLRIKSDDVSGVIEWDSRNVNGWRDRSRDRSFYSLDKDTLTVSSDLLSVLYINLKRHWVEDGFISRLERYWTIDLSCANPDEAARIERLRRQFIFYPLHKFEEARRKCECNKNKSNGRCYVLEDQKCKDHLEKLGYTQGRLYGWKGHVRDHIQLDMWGYPYRPCDKETEDHCT